MPNIEIKTRYSDLERARRIAVELGGQLLWSDVQTDTFFATRRGKLKLRESGLNGAELLPYVKVDQGKLKRSDYAKIPIADPESVRFLLAELLGTRLTVRKTREVYRVGNVRVHLDEVDGLGRFLEFEAVFDHDTAESAAAEQQKVRALMERFGISPDDLLQGSYVDMLRQLPATGGLAVA